MKLLEAEIVSAISDSKWVSPVHVVPKKGGIPIHPDDQEKTTFTCPYGTFAYRRMPFGLCNASATFQRVLTRCEEKDLVLNWEKCHFMVRDDIVLGHKILEKGIEVDEAKIEVMTSLQPPDSVKGIISFLDHAGFYRSECLEAFHTIKGALVSAPIVQPPDWELPFEVMCDASDYAVGVVLGQRKEKKLHVIYYASRKLNYA
ncbi:hypothetical protein N665_0027s0068 [Sinapis alba]|nr:hypothetical protein N665_0027s0068 [Sinapis alba]